MFLYAPYPLVQTIILLPEPLLGNTIQLQDERDFHFAMDKSVRSYVKRTDKKLYRFQFSLTREKAVELELFARAYGEQQWRILDHHNVQLIGHLISNPLEFQFEHLHDGDCTGEGYSLNEKVTVEMEFEST